ncbi:DUF2101 family protein [Thermococcus sp.]
MLVNFGDFLYSLGEKVERLIKSFVRAILLILKPESSKKPPSFKLTSKLIQKRFTVHELISLHLQIVFLAYLLLAFGLVVLTRSPLFVGVFSLIYLLYLRYILVRYSKFLLDPEPYRMFYSGVSIISSLSFVGYTVIRDMKLSPYVYYSYLGLVVIVVIAFWMYFKRTFKRDYTFGVIEDVKDDIVRVFIHDDISANVKPGYYWLPAVGDAKPGMVVKILVEDRPLRSAKPVRILEVYLSQSSQSSTEPKKETE